jgi:hypothetical protein
MRRKVLRSRQQSSKSKYLMFDTPRTHVFSVVAVHGIGAHPERTWTSNGVNWLSEPHMLPAALPSSRILTFGYASEWLGKEAINQRLPLVAEQLLRSLISLRHVTFPSLTTVYILI